MSKKSQTEGYIDAIKEKRDGMSENKSTVNRQSSDFKVIQAPTSKKLTTAVKELLDKKEGWWVNGSANCSIIDDKKTWYVTLTRYQWE